MNTGHIQAERAIKEATQDRQWATVSVSRSMSGGWCVYQHTDGEPFCQRKVSEHPSYTEAMDAAVSIGLPINMR